MKRKKNLDLTERGKSDDIAHGPIIQVSTGIRKSISLKLCSHNPRAKLCHERFSAVKGVADSVELAQILLYINCC